jgi:hypothetical protein
MLPVNVLSSFVQACLRTQTDLAKKVGQSIADSNGYDTSVYIYDDDRVFEDCLTIVVDGVRVMKKGSRYAVLSATAQTTLTKVQYTDLLIDCDVFSAQDFQGVFLEFTPTR